MNLDARGYFIYHTAGTLDSVKSQSEMMAQEMLSRDDVFTPERYVFYEKEGGHHAIHGADAMIEIFDGLPRGFGFGTGTVAEGWSDNAVAFLEGQIRNKT